MNEREMIKQAISENMPDFNTIYFMCKKNNLSGTRLMNKKIVVSLVIILIVISAVGTAYAASGLLGVGRVTEENINQLKNNGMTISDEISLELQALKNSEEISWEEMCMDIMKPITLSYENGEFMIKDIYIEAGYGVMFQKEDKTGFTLKEDDVLNCRVILDLSHMNKKNTSVGIEFGYILKGKYYVVEDITGSEFLFHINADEEGEYFPCIMNRSSASLVIDSGTVN